MGLYFSVYVGPYIKIDADDYIDPIRWEFDELFQDSLTPGNREHSSFSDRFVIFRPNRGVEGLFTPTFDREDENSVHFVYNKVSDYFNLYGQLELFERAFAKEIEFLEEKGMQPVVEWGVVTCYD